MGKMTESEFHKLTCEGFKAKTESERKALVDSMSKDQFARWLDRCVPPDHRVSLDSFTTNVYRLRRDGAADKPLSVGQPRQPPPG